MVVVQPPGVVNTTGAAPGAPGGVRIVTTVWPTLKISAGAPPTVAVVCGAKPVPCTMKTALPAAGPEFSRVPVTVGVGLIGDVTDWPSGNVTASWEPQATFAG